GEFDLSAIAGGIYTKLVTSITGLVIGLIAYLCYNFLHTMLEKNVNKMEVAAADFLDVLQEPTR
ncbi:MAG: biopolymer transporter ExbB, partial [Sphingobacteriales bacterium 12-47-4]